MHEGQFLIVQIDMDVHPREIESPYHTGDGVLLPTSCDGYYASFDDAQRVAEYLAERHPKLRTHIVKIVAAL